MKLQCVKCKSNYLKVDDSKIVCNGCRHTYKVIKGVPIMRDLTNTKNTFENDWLDRYKSYVKKHPKLYSIIVRLFAPIYSRKYSQKIFFELVKQDDVVINIGSGNKILDSRFINFDYYPYDNVDIVGDATSLPFEDESVDAIINETVLEHVDSPDLMIAEIFRVLKKGGIIYTLAPFIVGYHASPYDYQRWTIKGLESIHNKFYIYKSGVAGGPTSGLLWIIQEWLAQLLSFGVKPLYKVLYITIMLITWPIKYLDIFLVYHPAAQNIASTFYVLAKKPKDSENTKKADQYNSLAAENIL